MRRLKMQLQNCYGIQNMKYEIDFSNKNVAIIYAPNGTMKSSLANTFRALMNRDNPKESIYGDESYCKITDENDVDILAESIMVVNPTEEITDESAQGMLMANADLRKKYTLIYKRIYELKDKLYQQLKTNMGYSARSYFDVEDTLLKDWNSTKKDLFVCIGNIAEQLHEDEMKCSLPVEAIDYKKIFNEKIFNILTSGTTGALINTYEQKYNELVEKSLYMKKGVIDHNNYANISDALNSNGFFGINNEIILNAKDGSDSKRIKSYTDLEDLITKEKEQILNTLELRKIFEQINQTLIKNRETRDFNVFLQKYPDVIIEFNDIQKFKRKVWIKVFLESESTLLELLECYKKAQTELAILREEAQKEVTDWSKVLELFKERFFVPFTIEAANQEDVILNEDMPSFRYIFSDKKRNKEVAKADLLSVLSTGEKRAYFILNLIFGIMVARKAGKEKIIIMDDISESFDYKNKHAIIEYISDLSKYENENGEKLFKVVLLTHNFDFYRTVASRLDIRGNSHIGFNDGGEIKFSTGQYVGTLFKYYKDKVVCGNSDDIVVASIPFVRNLIEYTDGDEDTDYLTLTNLLHYKKDTKHITLEELQIIFNKHWCKNVNASFATGRETLLVHDFIINQADNVQATEKLEVENKVILSMAVRLLAEEFIIRNIREKVQGGEDVIENIFAGKGQTGKLIGEYKKYINDDASPILEQVSMLTPENIHLNSFMFEPILDMSLVHLYQLYQKVKGLFVNKQK